MPHNGLRFVAGTLFGIANRVHYSDYFSALFAVVRL